MLGGFGDEAKKSVFVFGYFFNLLLSQTLSLSEFLRIFGPLPIIIFSVNFGWISGSFRSFLSTTQLRISESVWSEILDSFGFIGVQVKGLSQVMIHAVTFLGWKSDPFLMVNRDLQLGDQVWSQIESPGNFWRLSQDGAPLAAARAKCSQVRPSLPPTGGEHGGEFWRLEIWKIRIGKDLTFYPKTTGPKVIPLGRKFSPTGGKKAPFESKKHHVHLSHIKPIEKKSCMWLMWICGCNKSDTQLSWQTVSQVHFFSKMNEPRCEERWRNEVDFLGVRCLNLKYFADWRPRLIRFTQKIIPIFAVVFCWRSKCRCNFVSQGHHFYDVSSFLSPLTGYRFRWVRTREACLISMTWRSGEQWTSFGAVKKLGNIVIYDHDSFEYDSDMYSKILVGKCWEARLPRHVKTQKCCLKGPGSFTKVWEEKPQKATSTKAVVIPQHVNLRDFRKWLGLKLRLFFLWF